MEIYKTIEEFDNYEISTNGNVRNKTTGKILKGSVNKEYHRVSLSLNGNVHSHSLLLHRLIATAFIENPENKPFVDHIDNNKVNNSLSNLRWATKKENGQNTNLSNRNTSGVKGVHFDKSRNKWQASIKIDGISINLGRFLTLEEAKQARITKANEAFGIFTNACEKLE